MLKQNNCGSNAMAAGQSCGGAMKGGVRAWLATRQGVIVIGAALVALALGLGWHWLVAVGAASLILAFAPCLAMCALGVCMMGRGSMKGSAQGCSSDRQNASGDSGSSDNTTPKV